MSSAVGWLHSKSAMGPALVVGQVVVENALGMLPVFDDDVVKAVPAGCRSRARRKDWP